MFRVRFFGVNCGRPSKPLRFSAFTRSFHAEDEFFEKHLQIHRSAAAFDVVVKQAEEVRERLKETERPLNKLRTDSGILSLADSTSALLSQRAKTQEDLMNAKAEFEDRKAGSESLGKTFANGGELPKRGELSKDTSDPRALESHLRHARVSVDDGILGHCLAAGEPVHVHDVKCHASFRDAFTRYTDT